MILYHPLSTPIFHNTVKIYMYCKFSQIFTHITVSLIYQRAPSSQYSRLVSSYFGWYGAAPAGTGSAEWCMYWKDLASTKWSHLSCQNSSQCGRETDHLLCACIALSHICWKRNSDKWWKLWQWNKIPAN